MMNDFLPQDVADQLCDAFPEVFDGRALIKLNKVRVSTEIAGKRVLITGAGGSVGSALTRSLIKFGPASLILLDDAENNLFLAERELSLMVTAGTQLFPILGDVADAALLDELFEALDPQITFHAAAYKHVPLLEGQPFAAIRNNVCGTYALLKKALRQGAGRVVLLSTDKAVNPVSILGASKRAAELTGAALSTSATPVTSVRFGNVLGSRGSLLPLIAEQINRRSAVTVTHPDATRFFLSSTEAANLLLDATWLGTGCDILVPELGRPVRILRVAEEMIRRAGLQPYEELPVVFTGLRPGEKLHEELFAETDSLAGTEVAQIYRITPPRAPASEIDGLVSALGDSLARRDLPALIEQVRRIVPEYQPSIEIGRAACRP